LLNRHQTNFLLRSGRFFRHRRTPSKTVPAHGGDWPSGVPVPPVTVESIYVLVQIYYTVHTVGTRTLETAALFDEHRV
jgi:hypothetical protein